MKDIDSNSTIGKFRGKDKLISWICFMEKVVFKVNFEIGAVEVSIVGSLWGQEECKLFNSEVAGFILWANVSLKLIFIYPSVWYKILQVLAFIKS